MRIMVNVLVGCYALAGVMSLVAPIRTVLVLSIVCWLVTIPYFLAPLLKKRAVGCVMATILMIITSWLAYEFPRVAAVVTLVGLLLNFKTVLKELASIANRLPLVLVGIMLYVLILLPGIPRFSQFAAEQTQPILGVMCLAAGIIATLLLLSLLRLLEGYHVNRADAAAVMLGFSSFLIVTFVSLLWTVIDLRSQAIKAESGPPSADSDGGLV